MKHMHGKEETMYFLFYLLLKPYLIENPLKERK